MDKYSIAASVLLDASTSQQVELSNYCAVYEPIGDEVLEVLKEYVTVETKELGSIAMSESGVFLGAEAGARVEATQVLVEINEQGKSLASGKSREDIAKELENRSGDNH